MGQAKVREPGTDPGPPQVIVSNYLTHILLPSRHMSKKLEYLELELAHMQGTGLVADSLIHLP